MGCEIVRPPGGGVMFICSRGGSSARCAACSRKATKLCDWPLRGEKTGQTCSHAICDSCALTVADVERLAEPIVVAAKRLPETRLRRRVSPGVDPLPDVDLSEPDTVDYCPVHARLFERVHAVSVLLRWWLR